MKWQIPAKTFLVGEYIAITGDAAIILTTAPCFSLELIQAEQNKGIHEQAPASLYWGERGLNPSNQQIKKNNPHLHFYDPYHGQGGLGASSAQFLAAYLASCQLGKEKPCAAALQNTYYDYAWNGEGLRPSAYDLIAQSQNRCVYIHRNHTEKPMQTQIQSYDWSFSDIAFVLLHSGEKMATHHYLQSAMMPNQNAIEKLKNIVEVARQALEKRKSDLMIEAVNAYQQELESLSLTTPSSLEKLQALKKNKKVLAAKGCGAMGSDVLLLLVDKAELEEQLEHLSSSGWRILATSHNLYRADPLIKVTDYSISTCNA
jgi:mevalonate kinase